jgi:hypothetical protein
MTTSRKLALLLASVGLSFSSCRSDPAAMSLDLLRVSETQLVEADVAGRDMAWVRGQAGKVIRIDDEVRRTLPAGAPSRIRFSVDVPFVLLRPRPRPRAARAHVRDQGGRRWC